MQPYYIIAIAFILGLFIGFFISFMLNRKLEIENKILKANKKTNEDILDLVKNEFVNMANSALIDKQKLLQEQNATALDEKIKPMIERIKDFQQKVEELKETGVKNNLSLMNEFELLKKNNQTISDEAQKLTNALTKNQNIKGAWGEGLIDTIFSKTGMVEGLNYEKQFQTKNIDDDTIRPDVVVHLPQGRSIIIDSKFTLDSFIRYQSSEDEDDLKNFKTAIKARIKDLSDKSYETAYGLVQPDFILLYVPLDNSLSILYQDEDLIQDALKKNIIMIGTSSLLVTLRLINQIWAQDKRNENVERIAQAGVQLYETFSIFCEELKKIQQKISELGAMFGTTIGRFTRGNKKNPSIFSQIEVLKDYGITTNKEIPQEFLEENEETEVTC